MTLSVVLSSFRMMHLFVCGHTAVKIVRSDNHWRRIWKSLLVYIFTEYTVMQEHHGNGY